MIRHNLLCTRQLLEENDAFAAAALEFQRQGKVAEAGE